ncbi:MAG: SDR family NAD(P)-dependent oxidoreductase [Acidimicrobiales bacterium]
MNNATGMPQSAVVIGGTSEIAQAILRALAARRLQSVVLAGRDSSHLGEVATDLRSLGVAHVETLVFDVTDVAHCRSVAGKALALLGDSSPASSSGGIDLVLVAAGMLGDQPGDEADPIAAADVLTTNFTGPAATMLEFAGILHRQGHGRMVVLSSVAGVRVRRENFVYGSSKAGLDAFATGLSSALAGTGASVMIVRPGFVATRMTAGMAPAPFATTADAVAADVLRGLERSSPIVWSPPVLRKVFAVARLVPEPLWRKVGR